MSEIDSGIVVASLHSAVDSSEYANTLRKNWPISILINIDKSNRYEIGGPAKVQRLGFEPTKVPHRIILDRKSVV